MAVARRKCLHLISLSCSVSFSCNTILDAYWRFTDHNFKRPFTMLKVMGVTFIMSAVGSITSWSGVTLLSHHDMFEVMGSVPGWVDFFMLHHAIPCYIIATKYHASP